MVWSSVAAPSGGYYLHSWLGWPRAAPQQPLHAGTKQSNRYAMHTTMARAHHAWQIRKSMRTVSERRICHCQPPLHAPRHALPSHLPRRPSAHLPPQSLRLLPAVCLHTAPAVKSCSPCFAPSRRVPICCKTCLLDMPLCEWTKGNPRWLSLRSELFCDLLRPTRHVDRLKGLMRLYRAL